MPQPRRTTVTRTNGAPTAEVTPEEAAKIRSSIGAKEQAPSSRVQSVFNNWREVSDQLGDPFEVERVPLSKLRAMRRDPMLAFGLSFTKNPHVAAQWYINASSNAGPNAQVAAHLDHDLRRIFPSFVLQYLNSLDFGYQAIAKRFEFRIPSGTYIEISDSGEQVEQPIWSEGGIQPIAWKPFVALRPEGVQPIWNNLGEFDGIEYSPQGTAFQSYLGSIGATSSTGGGSGGDNSDETYKIDLYHSLWVTNERDQNFGCSPYDEPVLTTNGWKLIGELDPDVDRLVTYDRRKNKIARREYREIGGKFEVGHRPYSGDLITISAGDFSTRVTPNHKLTVRWTPEAEKFWAVYIMRKGDWWRIGTTKLHKEHGHACSGVGNRMTVEGADDAWIISLHESKHDALYAETLLSNQYGIPDITFRAANGVLTTEDLEAIWAKLDSATPAKRLLRERKLDPELPFYTRNAALNKRERATQAGMRTRWTIFAANLLPGVMEVPTDPGDSDDPVWQSFEISHEHFEGDVYSLEVPPSHHYVSNGIITQNSVFGYARLAYAYRYWWSYWFRWAIADRAFERKADPSVLVYHPDGEFINPDTGERLSHSEYALLMGERMRSGGVIALPSEVYEDANGRGTIRQWEIDFTKDSVNFEPFDKSFDYLDVQKLRSLWIPEQAFLEGKGGTSSRNVAGELGDSFIESQKTLNSMIVEAINRWLIPQWLAVNYPEFVVDGGSAEIIVQGFADEDVEFMRRLIELVGQQESGAREIAKLVDLKKILQDKGAPIVSFAEQQRRDQELADEAAATQAPPTDNPIPGGTAVIPTATGFAYSAIPDTIYLSDSGNEFIENLPSSPHYEDKAIKGFSRQLWNLYRDLYRDEYRSAIAILASEEMAAQDAEEDEREGVELALSDFTGRAARMIRQWAGSAKWGEVLSRSQDIMGKVMRRAAKLELSRVGAKGKPSDDDLDAWLSEHLALASAKIAETTRSEVRDFIAACLEDGLTDRQEIAELARKHFDDFPGWKADRVVRTEVRDIYNAATLMAAQAAGIDRVQALDGVYGKTDANCENRDGQIFSVADAFKQNEHPNGTLGWRMVPVELSIEKDDIEQGAIFDEDEKKLTLSNDLDDHSERMILMRVVDKVLC